MGGFETLSRILMKPTPQKLIANYKAQKSTMQRKKLTVTKRETVTNFA